MTGAGDDGMEQAFAAEDDVLDAFDGLDVHGAGCVHGGQGTGVDDDLLSGRQVIFDGGTVDLGEQHAAAGDFLHDEIFAAEEACADLLVEEDFGLDACGGGQE